MSRLSSCIKTTMLDTFYTDSNGTFACPQCADICRRGTEEDTLLALTPWQDGVGLATPTPWWPVLLGRHLACNRSFSRKENSCFPCLWKPSWNSDLGQLHRLRPARIVAIIRRRSTIEPRPGVCETLCLLHHKLSNINHSESLLWFFFVTSWSFCLSTSPTRSNESFYTPEIFHCGETLSHSWCCFRPLRSVHFSNTIAAFGDWCESFGDPLGKFSEISWSIDAQWAQGDSINNFRSQEHLWISLNGLSLFFFHRFMHRLASILHPSCIHLASILHPSCIHIASILHPSCIHLASILHPSCIHLHRHLMTWQSYSFWTHAHHYIKYSKYIKLQLYICISLLDIVWYFLVF